MRNDSRIYDAPFTSPPHTPHSASLHAGVSIIYASPKRSHVTCSTVSDVFPESLGFPFSLFLGWMEVCQCSLRNDAACSAGGLSLVIFKSPPYQCGAFPDAKLKEREPQKLRIPSFGMGNGIWRSHLRRSGYIAGPKPTFCFATCGVFNNLRFSEA